MRAFALFVLAALPTCVSAQPKNTANDAATVLYRRFCVTCHGGNGNGEGRAARYVFPKPRNFRNGKFRLISADNRVASLKDIASVIDNGVPGTAMPSFSHLPAPDRKLLTGHVMKLWKDGQLDQIRAHLLQEEGEADEALVREIIKNRTTPGPAIKPPALPADEGAVERGRAIYVRQSCQSCHGKDGRGHLGQDLFDDRLQPTRARDFVVDELKSGPSFNSLYLRIRLGMPGTPMPSSRNLKPSELADLTVYVRSLGKLPKRKLTNHQRARLAVGVPLKSQ